jgi:hypothetical protein
VKRGVSAGTAAGDNREPGRVSAGVKADVCADADEEPHARVAIVAARATNVVAVSTTATGVILIRGIADGVLKGLSNV